MTTSSLPDPAAGVPVVAVRDVRRTFDPTTAPVRALRGVDLEVRAGEMVAVMGPSGSGKSTLLDVIAGLERPDAGSVEVAGVVLDHMDADALARHRRRHVGIVFQFFHLIDGMSAHDNVALAALVAGASRRRADAAAHEVLDLLGLLDKADAPPAALSGGLRQRLAIARALVNRPTVVLADEPTGALDSDSSAEVMDLLSRLHRDGQTIVAVTHDADVAARADRILQMRDGRITSGEERA
ncbi:ABC transporter ATP-binding protein [Actinomarinicola tropica]|uniref:ATP-binding cassette domain-containing protein n=1 Tax=Actinomarinicola tropica TaxID=2789776 RepID=A0A5Q2RIZ2_9ACTN|nr:ABC transporter ATP-binding protein [Actinomarinicola tropica]QGG96828.1 ATP-binding cassette domain-containing protein [Actinomarinicola tropica]